VPGKTPCTVAGVTPASVPDLTERVMQQLASASQGERSPSQAVHPIRRALAWIWAPRPLAVRPAYALIALVAALSVAALAGRGPGPELGPAAAGGPKVFVHFRIDAPDAGEVRLAGDFSGWEPAYPLHESAPGVWTVVVPLEPGVHNYAFAIDGERWVADPHAPQVADGFGGTNSRLAVLLPEPQEAR
jgi:hypothetical protein